MIKHILYIGLNDKDSKQQEIETLTAFKIVLNTVKAYYDGGTIKECKGFYKHESGAVTIETTLEVSILFAEENKTLALVQDLKQLLNQESIALQIEDIKSTLI